MTIPADPFIFHITHVGNLSGILQAGRLWSDAQRLRQGFAVTNIGHHHIKERRLRRPVPVAARGTLGDYVPFNFCPRSVMLYVVDRGHQDYPGGQDEVVHLVSRVRTACATDRPWAFTDRHAELGYALYHDDLGQLGQIDWSVMPRTQWADPEVKQLRQAELLVHDWFPWQAVEAIGVISEAMAARVRSILRGAAHKPAVLVRRKWYY